MKQSRAFRRIVILLLISTVVVLHTLIFWHFWTSYYDRGIVNEFFFKGHVVMLFLYALIFAILANVYGAFEIGSLQFASMAFSQCLAILFTNIILYLQISLLSLRLVSVVPMMWMTIENIALCLVWVAVSIQIYKAMYPPRDLLLIYSDREPDKLVSKIETRDDKYVISESIHCDEPFEDIMMAIDDHQSVLLCDIPSAQRNEIMKYCYSNDKRAYVTPKLSDIIILGSSQNNMFDSPLLVTKIKGLRWEQAFVKRLFDIIISLIFCIPTVFVMLICLICNFIWDKGPLFYKQERLTIDGKKFNIIKFRSMKVGSEKNGAQLAKKDDDRVTVIGKVLRMLHLDELPQVFNILKGDMSVVGPRPERPVIAEQYLEEIPEFGMRLKVKAGLTGYAQVYGKYNTTPYDKLKLDLYYIQHYRVRLDVQLIFMTFKIMFLKENSEGVDQDQTTAIDKKK